MDLHKAYGALDRYRCLEIFEGYIVGLWDHHIIHNYWYMLTIVARTGRYYGTAL